MENAYILLVHKNPDQLYKLINKLDDNTTTFFIHIDTKANLNDFRGLEKYGDKIVYLKREDGRWGGFGIVQAALNGLKAIKESNRNFDYIHLLSGQDYPIKSSTNINRYLERSPHSIFMTTYSALPVQHWNKGGINRITRYFFGLEKKRMLFAKFVNFSLKFIPPLKKKVPYELTIFGGSQWWTIDMYALNYILKYLETHPKLFDFFRYSLLSDEMFFQTILLNSKDNRILNSMAADNKRYIVIPFGKQHPITLTKDDFDALVKSDALFARKFDPAVDSAIFNLIDEHCLNQ